MRKFGDYGVLTILLLTENSDWLKAMNLLKKSWSSMINPYQYQLDLHRRVMRVFNEYLLSSA